MTRSTRYANRAGGRKYDASGALLPKTTDHPGAAAKLESATIFREAWTRVKERDEYKQLRKGWELEKKSWEKAGRPGLIPDGDGDGVVEEEAAAAVQNARNAKDPERPVDPASHDRRRTQGRQHAVKTETSDESRDKVRVRVTDGDESLPPRTRSAGTKRSGEPGREGPTTTAAKRKKVAEEKVKLEVKHET